MYPLSKVYLYLVWTKVDAWMALFDGAPMKVSFWKRPLFVFQLLTQAGKHANWWLNIDSNIETLVKT